MIHSDPDAPTALGELIAAVIAGQADVTKLIGAARVEREEMRHELASIKELAIHQQMKLDAFKRLANQP